MISYAPLLSACMPLFRYSQLSPGLFFLFTRRTQLNSIPRDPFRRQLSSSARLCCPSAAVSSPAMPRLPQPELPVAHHADLDSMLSRKFGKEVANYFSGRNIAASCDHEMQV
jgi:hypothetical protein